MGYAYTGSYDIYSGYQASFYNSLKKLLLTPVHTYSVILYYIYEGVTPDKINLGCPLYGITFDGLDTLGIDSAGLWYYNSLAVPGFDATTYNLPDIGAIYSYDPVKKHMISYDTAKVAVVKAQYVLDMGFRGTMLWEVR